ncbi:hypothetical protein BBJ28_00017199, partial [Nothophytophthora sp. Chile5]
LAEVEIVLLNQLDKSGQRNRRKVSSVHAFSTESTEFGMSKFVLRSELLNPANGFLTPEGRAEVEVQLHFVPVEAEEATAILDSAGQAEVVRSTLLGRAPGSPETANGEPESVLETTQHLMSYDSKQETGMVGLKNQGATCYLNSLLQTLFHLRAFRQVVYETPSEQEDTNDSVSLALQRVFYRLQRQRKAVSTKELTRSFGWSQVDSFMQHDVQELYRILCDRLEEKMKHTRVDAAIPKLFEGKVRSFVQCVNVDFQSFRDESFYDLQLDVKGCKGLTESFRKYVEIEMLQGDNQYEAEGYGKQDAKKGIQFLTFPPVLNIQLKRFEYDPMRDGMVKIHDRFEFPKTLVLDEFVSNEDEEKPDSNAAKVKAPRHIYHLHSVLVHSGDVHGGHYYVFIRPGKHIATSSDWFRFDDDKITRVDEQVAIEGNFGSAGSSTASLDTPTGPQSPLYSSSLFCSPERGGGGESSNGSNGMNSLEFRSVDTGGAPDEEDGRAVDDVYDYNRTNGNGGLAQESATEDSTASNGLMLPLGRSFSSAYMLVYVRDGENDIKAIQDEKHDTTVEAAVAAVPSSGVEDVPMTTGRNEDSLVGSAAIQQPLSNWQSDPLSIPEDLVTRFHEEEKAAARRKKAQQTEHLYMTVRIASDASIAKLKRITKTVDFSAFGTASSLRVRIKRTASIRQLYRRIYKEAGVPMVRQRLWKVITRENRTNRPDQPLCPEMYDCRVDSLIDEDASPKSPVRLYLQILDAAPGTSTQASSASSPLLSPSSPSIRRRGVGKVKKFPKCVIHRHFWNEFTPPAAPKAPEGDANGGTSQELGDEEDEDEEDAGAMDETRANVVVDHPPPLQEHDILLFVKFYDLKKKLGERLEYMGNLVVDARLTGAQLAKCLHEALAIPSTTDLILYEEVQPVSVSEIEMNTTLTASEIQHGDIICYQYAEDEEKATGLVIAPELAVEDDPDSSEVTYVGPDGDEVKTAVAPDSQESSLDGVSQVISRALVANGTGGSPSHMSTHQQSPDKPQVQQRVLERYPDVPSYFQYLLDRVEITFHRYGRPELEPFTLTLLYSNVYDEVVEAVATRLGLLGPKRLYLRLYQHSPLNGLPMKTPLRHSRYSGDDQTTLEELLTEYLERTTTLYYELLEHPITEIEAKKQLLVYLSVYDACFATEGCASPPPLAQPHHIEVLVLPTHKVRDMLALMRESFTLPPNTRLRACEVVQGGAMIERVLKEDASLSRYWENAAGSDPNAPALFVEQIPSYELTNGDIVTKDGVAVVGAETDSEASSENEELQSAERKAEAESVLVERRTALDATRSDQQEEGNDAEQRASDAAPDTEEDDSPVWFEKGVVHFNFQNSSQTWIHPHGVPCIVRFHERETVGQVKERIRQRMGISLEVFAQWNFALVKELKASTLRAVYDEMDVEALDAFPMARLQELCGADFEGVANLGLEHADPTPPPRHHSSRRQEQGIRIRQS